MVEDLSFFCSCCFYVLLIQFLVLAFDGVALIRGGCCRRSGGLVYSCLPAALGLSWFVLSFSTLHCKFKVFEKFPVLLVVVLIYYLLVHSVS